MKQYRTIVVADHHKSVFVCQVIDRETGEVHRRTLKSRRSVLEPFLGKLEGPVHLFVEACRAWEWVSDLADELGIDMTLVDPSRMPEIAYSRNKTDERDVEAMVERLLVTGELPSSYRVSRAERELRGLTRQLSRLRKDKRTLGNRIHAVIDCHGLPTTQASFRKESWREELKSKLSADAWLVVWTLLRQWDVIRDLMAEIEERVESLVREREDYKLLLAIPGVGRVIGATILAETAGIERFESARKFAAFTGLVPRVRSSGGKKKGATKIGRITRCGPSDLRWALGQAAMVGLRARQQTAVSSMYRRKKKKGKPGRVAICAASHKLARAVYVVLTRGEEFEAKPTRRKKAA